MWQEYFAKKAQIAHFFNENGVNMRSAAAHHDIRTAHVLRKFCQTSFGGVFTFSTHFVALIIHIQNVCLKKSTLPWIFYRGEGSTFLRQLREGCHR